MDHAKGEMENCKGAKYIMIKFDFARAKTFVELSLRRKLGGPLRRSSMQTLLNTDTILIKASITFKLSLFNKFGRITTLEFG